MKEAKAQAVVCNDQIIHDASSEDWQTACAVVGAALPEALGGDTGRSLNWPGGSRSWRSGWGMKSAAGEAR